MKPHRPSRGHYNDGCREPECREANAAYMRRYRAHGPGPKLPPKPKPVRQPGDVKVTCWCEARSLWVPAAEVLAGRTRSCGGSGCEAP